MHICTCAHLNANIHVRMQTHFFIYIADLFFFSDFLESSLQLVLMQIILRQQEELGGGERGRRWVSRMTQLHMRCVCVRERDRACACAGDREGEGEREGERDIMRKRERER